MFRRLFWFVIGAGVAVFVYTKLRQYVKKASPDAIGQRFADSASGLSESAAASFTGYEPEWRSAKRSSARR